MVIEYIRCIIRSDRAAEFEQAEESAVLEAYEYCLGYKVTRGVEEPEHSWCASSGTRSRGHEQGFGPAPASQSSSRHCGLLRTDRGDEALLDPLETGNGPLVNTLEGDDDAFRRVVRYVRTPSQNWPISTIEPRGGEPRLPTKEALCPKMT
jgi:hypothetical protein